MHLVLGLFILGLPFALLPLPVIRWRKTSSVVGSVSCVAASIWIFFCSF